MQEVSPCLATPVVHTGDNEMRGGLYDADRRFTDLARHRRIGDEVHHADLDLERLSQDPSKVVEGTSLYGGVYFDHFGHFLVESLGRLWCARTHDLQSCDIFINPIWGATHLADPTSFAMRTFGLLGIDGERIKTITEPTLFRRLVVPEQLYGFADLQQVDPRFMEFLLSSQRAVDAMTPGDAARRIYVSRAKWPASRGLLAGEEAFEAYLVGEGWTPFYPEDHSLEEQLRAYNGAEKLIFCEGSAHHSLVLIPRLKAEVALLKRQPEGVYPISESQLVGLGIRCTTVQAVEKQIMMGLPLYNALSIADLEAASRRLVDIGFVSRPYSDWSRVREDCVASAVGAFIEAHRGDRRVLLHLANGS